MNVQDLIGQLQTLDPNLPVVLDHFEDGHVDLGSLRVTQREHEPHEYVVVLNQVPPPRRPA